MGLQLASTGMNKTSWAKIKSWISLNVFKQPVREMPRERCAHSTGCYLCPRSRCVGSLNDRDDPDLTKPRPSSSGHCIHVHGENGLVILRVSMESANARAARRAAEEQAQIPPHLWKPPGYDEEDVVALLKSIAD
jgi:hypothetical protein